MTSLFFSYTHKDEALRDELEAHLSLLKRQGLIDVWHDRRILAGDAFDDTISAELERADIILLLVSSNFIASNYCYSKEMTRAMEKDAAKEARVIPVILRECDWHSAPFGKLIAAPKDGKAVTTWPDRDVAFTDVARQVRAAVESMNAAKGGGAVAPAGRGAAAPVRLAIAALAPEVIAQPIPNPMDYEQVARLAGAMDVRADASSSSGNASSSTSFFSGPRSSNLRLKKEFTDLDHDNFVHECFDYMVRFFESSIAAIKERSADVDGRVERIDSRRFAASLYRGGKAIAQCSVQRGSPGSYRGDGRSITFSNGSTANSGAYNEQLTVHASDQSLYLKALGMGSFDNRREQQLSAEGASELLWGMFIERAQG